MTQVQPRFSWGHINLNVASLERAIEFYRKLGFEVFLPGIPYLALSADEAGQLPDGAAEALGLERGTGGRACILQLGDGFPKLDLTEIDAESPRAPLENRDRGLVRICLATEDLPAEVTRLEAEGVEFLSTPQPGHGKLAEIAVCRDPDGALIEILQIYPERWQALLAAE